VQFNGDGRPFAHLQVVDDNATRRCDMLTKTKMVLAAALILGSTASAALARGSYGGPVQTWCDINPACNWWDRSHASHGNAGNAFGYVASPHRTSHARTHGR
jgi:hypothetical protein